MRSSPALAAASVADRVTTVRCSASAVVPVVPVTDTLRLVGGGAVDRSNLVAVQTPQGFDVALLRRAHEDGGDATDDASLIDALGGRVLHVEGERLNIKITEPSDLAVAEALLRGVADNLAAPSSVASETTA